jgi:hypothetical protein
MSDPVYYTVAEFSCAYIGVFIVIYCFPYAVPFTAASMNYGALITGDFTMFVSG